ncbi:60Kd inner membrane protein-domain-containing protein [Bisporella sp. PMI_857]|nr:60Kd inner membrane protein-domain-containing protein [Bisporella sp. PMI_857]
MRSGLHKQVTMTTILRGKRVPISPPRPHTIFLQLPSSYRSFHASPRPQFVESLIPAAHTFFDGIHSATGLPWAYALPLGALVMRTAVVLPFSIYTRLRVKKQRELTPLLSAWQHQLQKETMREVGHKGPQAAHLELLKKSRNKRIEIYRRWGCQYWKNFLPFIQVPFWLLAMEGIRAMCGAHVGLLGMIFRVENKDAVLVPLEPSLATEGMLWFPNLLLPDPMLILPFVLSGVMFLNIARGGLPANATVWQKRLDRTLKVVALAIGPVTLQVPSAMLVYWISSSSIAYLQGLIVDKSISLPRGVSPPKPYVPAKIPINELFIERNTEKKL